MGFYKVSVDQPNRPDGDPIEIPSGGVVKNREGYIVVSWDDDTTLEKEETFGIKITKASEKEYTEYQESLVPVPTEEVALEEVPVSEVPASEEGGEQ